MVPLDVGKFFSSFFELFDNRSSGEETAVVRKPSVPDQDSLVPERGNPVADGLGSFRWDGGANRCANLLRGAAGRFRDSGKVFIDVFRSALGFRGKTAIARFRFFYILLFLHGANATRKFRFESMIRTPGQPLGL